MTDTLRNQWSIPAWSADWQVWQSRFAETMDDMDSTVFANTEGLKFVFKQLPNARVIDDAGTKKLQMASELKLISRTLNITVNVDYSTNLTLIPGHMICATVTPGAVGEQSTSFELYGSVPVDPSIRVFGYITDSYSINWYNGSVLGLGESYRQIFSFLASAGSDTEKVRASTADTTAGFLDTKVVAGDGITITTLNPGGNESLEISADNKVKVTSSDTTEDYLYPSLVAGSNVTLTVLNPGGNEQIQIDASSSGTDTYKVKVTSSDTTEDYLYPSLVAGRDISLTVLNPGGNETIRIDNALLTNNQIVYGSPGGLMDQSSGLTWDDTNLYVDGSITLNDSYITGATYIDWVADGVSTAERRQFWDDSEGYMVIGMKGGTVNLQIGGEELVRGRNDVGITIDNGVGIMIDGGTGSSPIFSISDITLGVDCKYIGLSTEDILDNTFGYGNTSGLVRGETSQPIDTSSYTAGDRLWEGIGGVFTGTQPAAGNASISIGYVVRSHATEGVILHFPHCVPFLSYLSDVNARGNTHDEGAILSWDDTNGYWDLNTAVFSLNHDTTERTGDVTLYAGSGIVIDGAIGGYTISALVSDIIYTADSITRVVGTEISGTVTDTETVNLVGYVIQEVTGVPGYDIAFEFVSVESFDRIQAHVLYSASSSGHTVHVQMYNYDTTLWDDFTTFGISVGYQIIDIPVASSSDYVDGTGNARVRFYHDDSGNTSHQIVHDYVALVKSGGAAGGGTLDNAYDFGGSGAGRLITADAGYVGITVPIGSSNSCLTLTALEPGSGSDLVNLYNDTTGVTIYMGGSIGSDFTGEGHRIAAGGPVTLKSNFAPYGNTYIQQYTSTSEGTDYPVVEIYAQRTGGTAWSKIEVETDAGESVTLSTSGTVNLEPDGNIYFDPGGGMIYSGDAYYRSASAYLLSSPLTDLAVSTGTVTANFATGTQNKTVDLDASVTEVAVINPVGCGTFVLCFISSAVGTVTVANWTSGTSTPITWIGNYDLNASALAVPSGTVLEVEMRYYGVTIGWTCKVVTEV